MRMTLNCSGNNRHEIASSRFHSIFSGHPQISRRRLKLRSRDLIRGARTSPARGFLLFYCVTSWTYIEIDVNGHLTVVFTVKFSHFGNEGKVTMILSITRSAAAALVVGSVLLVTTSDGRAAMSAQDKYDAAQAQCESASKGQRSFCMIEAHSQFRADSAKEQKKDVTVHHDFDASNDTPAQKTAKESYNSAADACMDMSKGQRSFCMEEAHSKYRKGMGW